MLETLRRLPLARATQAALTATILCALLGSSSIAAVTPVGSKLRWAALFAFAASAYLWCLAEARPRLLSAEHLVAATLCGLALVSAAWSVAPWLTIGRAVSLAVVVSAAAAVGAVVRSVPEHATLIGEAIVAAAVVAFVGGLAVYAVDPALGAQPAVLNTPFRLRGLGESPNTVPLLAALGIPLASWLAWAGGGRHRAAYSAATVVLGAEIVLSGSRSALGGACLGLVAFAAAVPARSRRRRLLLLAASGLAGALLVGGIVGMVAWTALPAPAPRAAPVPPPASLPLPRPILPALEDELGGVPTGARTLFGKDGRSQALAEAIDQADQRFALGWGFGTEERVFVDRLAQFHASRPENSYVGLYLQLGAAGLALFVALPVLLALATFRSRTRPDPIRLPVAGTAGAVAAGLGLAVGQSYLYAAGNVATVAFWASLFLLAGLAAATATRRTLTVGAVAGTALLALAAVGGPIEEAHARKAQLAGIERIWERVGRRLDAPALDGFRLRAPGRSCLLYRAGGKPGGLELCFAGDRLVQAIDRSGAGFRAWSVEPFGSYGGSVRVSAAALERTLRALGASGRQVGYGPGYLARTQR